MENVVIRGILFSPQEIIRPEDVGFQADGARLGGWDQTLQGLPYKQAKETTLRQFNHAYIGELLAQCDGNVTQAARTMGMERQALQQIMRRYNIDVDKYRA
jgi:DNA-binding NtrC family response regulator